MGKQVENLLQAIKGKGGRITRFRRLLFSFLEKASAPQGAADILRVLKTAIPSLNRSTVYRELAFLGEAGLLREVNLSGCPPLYELAIGHRHHLVCLACQSIKPIEMDKELEKAEVAIGRQEGFAISDHSLEFYGLCANCQSEKRKIIK